jgi:hypothetical protein
MCWDLGGRVSKEVSDRHPAGIRPGGSVGLQTPVASGRHRHGCAGEARNSRNLDPGGLSNPLQAEASSSAPSTRWGSLRSPLDSDGDGQVVDDIARIGSRLLGGLFDKK